MSVYLSFKVKVKDSNELLTVAEYRLSRPEYRELTSISMNTNYDSPERVEASDFDYLIEKYAEKINFAAKQLDPKEFILFYQLIKDSNDTIGDKENFLFDREKQNEFWIEDIVLYSEVLGVLKQLRNLADENEVFVQLS